MIRSTSLARKAATFLTAVLSAAAAVFVFASPAHASDYRRESTKTFAVTMLNDQNPCTGTAWIGQTWNGYIESYTSVDCPTWGWQMTARTKITNAPLGTVYAEKPSNCPGDTNKGWCYAAVSISGSNGKRYCNEAWGTQNGFVAREGYEYTCIYT